jgi:hypothetical protein
MCHMGALCALWEVDGPIWELCPDNWSPGLWMVNVPCHLGAAYGRDCTIWGSTQHLGAIWKPAVCNILEAEGTMADGTKADGTTWNLHVPYDGNMGAMCALWELYHHVGAPGAIQEINVPYGSHMRHTGTV